MLLWYWVSVIQITALLNLPPQRQTHRDKGFAHATPTINVILAHDPIAIMNSLTTLKSARVARIEGGKVRRGHTICRAVRIKDIDTSAGEILSVTIRRENLDCIINARHGKGGLVGMTCPKPVSPSVLVM